MENKYPKTYYLTNIRWVTVCLVLFYHVCYIFNGVGILGNIPGSKTIPFFDVLACIIYPWFMILLFVVAGVDSYYSLSHRTDKEFLKARTVKLLIPSTLGLFVYQWLTGYMGMLVGGSDALIPKALVYPISVLSGTGPLWFIQLLWLYSLLLVLIRKLDKKNKLWKAGAKANFIVVLLLGFVIWMASQILNMPVITVYRFGVYFTAYLIGYFIFSHQNIQDEIEKYWLPLLICSIILAGFYGYHYYGVNFTDAKVLQSGLTSLYLWIVVLAVFACFKKFLNKETNLTDFMANTSFGIYICHYPVLEALCILTSRIWDLPAIVCYLIGFIGIFPLTLGVYEIFKRIPVIRYLVLGITNKNVK